MSRRFICFDCEMNQVSAKDLGKFNRCEHWRPKYWEAQGFKRNWGDAAVMNEGNLEILRKEEKTPRDSTTGLESIKRIEYVILCPLFLRRPVTIFVDATTGFSWGGY